MISSIFPWCISHCPIHLKIYPYPFACKVHPPAQFIVPEGVSPVHLLYILMLEGVLKAEFDDYSAFVRLQMDTTWSDSNNTFFSLDFYNNVTIVLQKIFPPDSLKNASTKMIIMGSELGAGGSNDILMLLLLEQLHRSGLQFEILLSASSGRHIQHAEREYVVCSDSKSLLDDYMSVYDSPAKSEIENAQSLYSCLNSLWMDIDLLEKVKALYATYRQHLTLASYCTTAGKVVLVSNRALSKQAIANMTAQLLNKLPDENEGLSALESISVLFDERPLVEAVAEMNALFRRCMEEENEWHERLFSTEKGRNPLLEYLKEETPKERHMIERRMIGAVLEPHRTYALHGSSAKFARQEISGLLLASKNKMNAWAIENCTVVFPSIEGACPISALHPSQPNRRYFSNTVQTLEVNLDRYPSVLQTRPKITVIGDTHANPLFKIFFLITKQVIEMKSEDYISLGILFNEFANENLLEREIELLVARLQNELNSVCRLCPGAEKTRVIFNGDDLGDRGVNDLIDLILYEWLENHGVEVEVPVSNHGFEHIRQAVYDYRAPSCSVVQSKSKDCIWVGDSSQCASSLIHMLGFVRKSPSMMQLAIRLFENHYKHNIKVISYVVREKTAPDEEDCITLIYHAPVGMKTFVGFVDEINGILQEKGMSQLKFETTTMNALKASIDDLNDAFLFCLEELVKKANRDYDKSSIYPLIWSRYPAEKLDFKTEGEERFAFDGMFFGDNAVDKNYQVHVIHAHTGIGAGYPELADRVINLEGKLGQPSISRGLLRTVDYPQ